MKIVVTRPIPETGITLLSKQHEVVVQPQERALSRDELKAFIRGAHAMVSMVTDRIDSEVLEAAGSTIKIVANYAVGYDNIDLAAARQHNVLVTNTPEVLSEAVAEHAFALAMAVARRIVEADHFTRAGRYQGWDPKGFLGIELKGKTIGVIGLGRIGSRVSEIASSFGMSVVYHDIKQNPEFDKRLEARFLSKEDLLKTADIISLHLPLVPQTKHFVSRSELAIMKSTAILINTSRGGVVDEAALVQALRSRKIFGAGLDVYEEEPQLTAGLAELRSVVLTPHIASATGEAREAMSRVAAENVLAALAGKTPPNLVK